MLLYSPRRHLYPRFSAHVELEIKKIVNIMRKSVGRVSSSLSFTQADEYAIKKPRARRKWSLQETTVREPYGCHWLA